jgi:hypothetical protein
VTRYTKPEQVALFFEQHDIPIPDMPSFYWKAIEPARELGFRVLQFSKDGDMVIITPRRTLRAYRGFKRTKQQLGMILMHAMLSNPLH